MPRRTTGVFLIVVAALFALRWLSQIAGAITSGELLTAVTDLNLPTSGIYVLDLAFTLPILMVAGLWLLRHDPRGPASALAGLRWLALTGLSVPVIFGMGRRRWTCRRPGSSRDLHDRYRDRDGTRRDRSYIQAPCAEARWAIWRARWCRSSHAPRCARGDGEGTSNQAMNPDTENRSPS